MPPSEEDALKIIEGIADRYEAFHQIRYSHEALEAAVYQTNRYIPDRFLPDKAIDVLDEAGARAKLRYQQENTSDLSWKETIENWKRATANEEQLISFELETMEDSFFAVEVTKDDVEEVIARWTGIPVQRVKQEEGKKLLLIEAELHKRIISQRPAISALARAIRRSRAGLKNPNKPVGSFFIFRSDRSRQNRSRPQSGRIPVRFGAFFDSLRYVGIYGKTHGCQIYRLAARIRRTRRRRTIDRKTAPFAVFGRAFR